MGTSRRVRIQWLAFWGFVAAAVAGCNSAKVIPPDPDALPFVQCKVVMGGKDVEGAIVAFHAEGVPNRSIVSAYDSENDVYRFITSVDGKKRGGVPAGEYKVTVKPGRGSKIRVPEKYADPKRTDLTAKIVEGDNFLSPFELTP